MQGVAASRSQGRVRVCGFQAREKEQQESQLSSSSFSSSVLFSHMSGWYGIAVWEGAHEPSWT